MIERQCQGWGASYAVLGPFGLVASHAGRSGDQARGAYTIDSWEDWNGLTIWMDGRPASVRDALHTQEGFTHGRGRRRAGARTRRT
jgi:hypothetical protein